MKNKKVSEKGTTNAAEVPSELDYEYEMWFWFDPFISNKKCAFCIISKGIANILHSFPTKNCFASNKFNHILI